MQRPRQRHGCGWRNGRTERGLSWGQPTFSRRVSGEWCGREDDCIGVRCSGGRSAISYWLLAIGFGRASIEGVEGVEEYERQGQSRGLSLCKAAKTAKTAKTAKAAKATGPRR